MEYTKPAIGKIDLGVEHCMCGGRLPVLIDLGP